MSNGFHRAELEYAISKVLITELRLPLSITSSFTKSANPVGEADVFIAELARRVADEIVDSGLI